MHACIGEKTVAHALIPHLQRVHHHAGIRAELSPDDATGLPRMERIFTEGHTTRWHGHSVAPGCPHPLQNGSSLVLLRPHSRSTES